MAAKTPKVGDPVLWYGHTLNVVAIHARERPGGTVTLVECADLSGRKEREAARAKILELREKQQACGPDDRAEHSKLHDQIKELQPQASSAFPVPKLRADLLDWWEERGVWVSEGRILADAQRERFKKVSGGRKIKPQGEREALLLLEGS